MPESEVFIADASALIAFEKLSMLIYLCSVIVALRKKNISSYEIKEHRKPIRIVPTSEGRHNPYWLCSGDTTVDSVRS